MKKINNFLLGCINSAELDIEISHIHMQRNIEVYRANTQQPIPKYLSLSYKVYRICLYGFKSIYKPLETLVTDWRGLGGNNTGKPTILN